MHDYNVFFKNVAEPKIVRGMSFADAEKAGMKADPFHEIEKIEVIK